MNTSRGRARFGVLVPFTNTNLEPDLALMCPAGISLHVARMGGYDEDEIPDESQMHGLGAADLDESLRLLLGAKPDVVLYGCTSATLTHGPQFDRELATRISAESGAKTVTAAGALVHALTTLGAKRIGFASPYVPAINNMAIGFLDELGFETVQRSEVTQTLDNTGQGALDPDAVFQLGLAADHPKADVLVLSCTDMRSVETLARLEIAVGKPVISSNQAMLFQAMHLLNLKEPIQGFGQLLERPR
ncbi:Asp/Glu racemase [Ruegeria lacuscaerulensis]|uniref:maleate cis-trans isomerase family protein n=1 Tax=Ruegeria lacuscaerulensis TaxID=55218 RepID=UPI00147C70E6|nr:Asp/Glu racemase [Ruegeria lacuscaerulensis]